MNTEKILALLALKRVPNLGDSSVKRLIRHVGCATGVLTARKEELLKIDGIGAIKLKGLYDAVHMREAEKELRYMEHNSINYTAYDDPDYPERLKHCIDSPVVLFGRGDINLQHKKMISIVGTRKVTSYGSAFCEELIASLTPLDPVIVSGFAYGVDICAHKAAMSHGLQTIGCLAHGFNQIYPKVHQKYVTAVEENGGFYTDYWSTDSFDRKNFLGRNRIIAGLSEATIVIESADKGGSLVTAELASSYNRDVFAVPGRVTDPYSKGCNTLIKTQKAHVLTSAADLLYILNWELNTAPKQGVQQQLFVELSAEEQQIYDFLRNNGKQLLDVIALRCKIPTFQLASQLLTMELKGVIRPLPGKLFEVI